MSVINKLGRRKSSVARIYLKSGKGKITINKRDHKDYFTTDVLQYKIFQPFELTGTKGKYDATINVNGGGSTGQVEAIRLAISRALVEGIAKPTPSEPPLEDLINVFIPINLPIESINAPPELPLFIEASVWI